MYNIDYTSLTRHRPQAMARIHGSDDYPRISGNVYFYQTRHGVLVVTNVSGLPTVSKECSSPIYAFHIHSGESCTGNAEDPFADALMHYNPHNCPHPYHAGDMPPLFGCNGNAFSAFLTNRFRIHEIIGKTVIIHSKPDDFTTQPSGNAGTKIACGKIRAF